MHCARRGQRAARGTDEGAWREAQGQVGRSRPKKERRREGIVIVFLTHFTTNIMWDSVFTGNPEKEVLKSEDQRHLASVKNSSCIFTLPLSLFF